MAKSTEISQAASTKPLTVTRKPSEISKLIANKSLTLSQKAIVIGRLIQRSLHEGADIKKPALKQIARALSEPSIIDAPIRNDDEFKDVDIKIKSEVVNEAIIAFKDAIILQIKGDKSKRSDKIRLLEALLAQQETTSDEKPYCRGAATDFITVYINALLSEINFQHINPAIEQWIKDHHIDFKSNITSAHVEKFIGIIFNGFCEKNAEMLFLYQIIQAINNDMTKRADTNELERKKNVATLLVIKVISFITDPIQAKLVEARNKELEAELDSKIKENVDSKVSHFRKVYTQLRAEKEARLESYNTAIKELVKSTNGEMTKCIKEIGALEALDSSNTISSTKITRSFSQKVSQQIDVITKGIGEAILFNERFTSYFNLKTEDFIDHSLDDIEHAILKTFHPRQRSQSAHSVVQKKAIHDSKKPEIQNQKSPFNPIKVFQKPSSRRLSMQLAPKQLSPETEALKNNPGSTAPKADPHIKPSRQHGRELSRVKSDGDIPQTPQEIESAKPQVGSNGKEKETNRASGKHKSFDLSFHARRKKIESDKSQDESKNKEKETHSPIKRSDSSAHADHKRQYNSSSNGPVDLKSNYVASSDLLSTINEENSSTSLNEESNIQPVSESVAQLQTFFGGRSPVSPPSSKNSSPLSTSLKSSSSPSVSIKEDKLPTAVKEEKNLPSVAENIAKFHSIFGNSSLPISTSPTKSSNSAPSSSPPKSRISPPKREDSSTEQKPESKRKGSADESSPTGNVITKK